MGFKVVINDGKCWCPCGKQMSMWRQPYDPENLDGERSKAVCCVLSEMSTSGNFFHYS